MSGDAVLQPPGLPRARPARANAGAPRHARAAGRARAALRRARLARLGAARGAGGERAASSSSSTPRATSSAIRELCAAGGGAIDPDTFVGEASYAAALHAAGGACEMTRALLAGEARGRLLRAAALRATTPRPAGRWASACSTTSRSRPPRRSPSSASSGSWSSTGTSTTATAPPRSSASAPTCSSPASTSRRSIPGTGPLRTRARGRARATRSTCPVPPGSGEAAVAGAARATS